MTALDRIDGITTGVAFKAPVKAVTSAAITLSGLQTIGGVTLVAGDRVLVKNQTDAKENGIYNAATSSWTRALDFDGARDVVNGTLVTVAEDSSSLRQFRLVATDPVVFGTSELEFRETTSTGGGQYGSDYGLTYDGTTDQSVALQAVLNDATGAVRLISSGTSLFLANRVKMPAGVTLDVSQITVDLGQYGEILIQGELGETPEENLYQLAATASPGATSITVDTTPQGGHTALVEDVFIVMRGENDANGIAKQRYYGRITSKDTSGGAASVVLGIDPPIPSDEGTFSTTYPDSAWNPDVGGPATDRSLITIATASLLTSDADRGDTSIAVANGALFPAGDVCMVQDDRHATDPGSETGGLPMRQELVRVRSVATNTVTLEKALSRDFLTSENAALFKVNAVSDAHIIAGTINQVEAVDASPESRTHATLMFFADRCSVTGVRLLEDANSYSPRGAACRVTRSLECRVADVWRIGPKSTAEGDGNGVMVAYSADTVVENCYLERCRHGIINQGSTRSLVRNNITSNCLINGLDDHGVYETDSQYHDNLIVGGPSLASGSTQQLGMTLGNTRWLEGSRHARVWNNKFVSFGGGSNGGIAVRQASDDVLIQGNSLDGCATGIHVLRDSRAGVRVTTDVVIRDNQFRDCTTNVTADGGLDDWAVDVTYSGTTARPVSVLASNGREYSTAVTKLGGSEPSHTSGTTDDWLHIGLAVNGINGLRVYGNDAGGGSDSITVSTITGLVRYAGGIRRYITDTTTISPTDGGDPPDSIPLDLDVDGDDASVYDFTGTLTGNLSVSPDTTGMTEGRALTIKRSGTNGAFDFAVEGLAGDASQTLATDQSLVLVFDGTAWQLIGVFGDSTGVTAFAGSVETITADAELTAARAYHGVSSGNPRVRTLLTKPASTGAAIVLTLPDDAAPGLWNIVRHGTHTGAVTIVNESAAGAINGTSDATITLSTEPWSSVIVEVLEQPGSAVVARARGDIVAATTSMAAHDFNGQVVHGNLLKVVSATGTLDGDHLGAVVVTTGNVTIPTTAGWHATLIMGGAHTISFNSTTSASMASGDVVSVIVQTSSIIHAAKLASADKVAFS